MKAGDKLLKELNKKYALSSTIPLKFGRYDLVIKTNGDGDAILLLWEKRMKTEQLKETGFQEY